ncbi:hypothetical protein ABT112_26570 [Streptomyces sp. NPDC002055]|uniref:hypothetical protein n=1 Tax=Streptomyces sp. NPDC002055 TaxID=3154534 RepID=UPI0033186FE7
MTDARSLSRHVRAAVFAAVCVLLAAAGHVMASGRQLPGHALLAAFAVTAAAAWLAARRRRGILAIGTGLLTTQAALHLLFSGGHRALRPDGAREMAGMAATSAADGMRHAAGTTGTAHTADSGDSGVMLTAHLAAAVCCALWLWRGETAFFRLLGALSALAFSPLRLLLAAVLRPALPGVTRPAPCPDEPGRERRLLLAHVLSRRGPPCGAVHGHVTPTGVNLPGFRSVLGS